MYDLENTIQYSSGISLWQLRPDHVITATVHADLQTNRFEFYFECEYLDELERMLRKRNVEFLHSVLTESWGQKTIRFFDPDRHLIEVGESRHTFITRMHNEGQSLEQIHKRTMLPINKIVQLLTENNT
jgi:hypothetical protein